MEKETLLIIEDNPLLSGMYKSTFEKRGLNVIIAFNGEMGLQIVKEHPINIIILDLLMPGMNGIEILRKLKNNPETKEIKVFILTSVKEQDYIDDAKKFGAADYLIKTDLALSEIVDRVLKI